MRLRSFGKLDIDPDDAGIQIAIGIILRDLWQRVGIGLFRDDREGWHIPAWGHLDANELSARFDHNMVADFRAKHEGLHADKCIVADFRRPMDLRLMGE